MFSSILAFLSSFLTFAVGSAFPGSVFQSTIPVQKTFYSRCYQIEPDVKLSVKREDLIKVHDLFPTAPLCFDPVKPDDRPNGLIDNYTRIRRNVHIIAPKVAEGTKSNGGCDYTNRIRWVGQQNETKIYWLDSNYQAQDLRDFAAVLVDKKDKFELLAQGDKEDYVFDFYARDSILGNLPDYIVNCKESGGLVPVVEVGSDILPPQVVPIKDIDTSLFKKNYEETFLKQNTSFPPFKNYLIKIDKQNLPEEAIPKGQIGVYTTPLMKNVRYKYDIFYHLGSFYLRDQKDKVTYVYGTSRENPPINIPQNTSLQLGRMYFRVVDSWTAFTPNCKPAIYLYPEKPTDITVKLRVEGKITVSNPIYDEGKGWHVKAYPDGRIEMKTESLKDTPDGGLDLIGDSSEVEESIYPYLFYEAELEKGYKPGSGWVISRQNIGEQLNIILTQLGLSEKEKSDFADYWIPRLTSKPYYFAGLAPIEDIDQQEVLTINPSPTSIIRVRLIFEGLEYPLSATAPKLSEIKRGGFTVVDWGGTVTGETCEGRRIQ